MIRRSTGPRSRSERGRATSVANADARGRPRRSVLSLGGSVRIAMKLRIATAVVACVVLAGVAWVLTLSTPPAAQTARFAGFTNGVVGLAPVFSTLHTNYAATIQRWLQAGTNVAEFTITNQQNCAIWLYPVGRICTTEASSMSEDTPLLNAPNFSGIRLPPGQAATVQVAVLPHQTPWRLQFSYHRESCSDTFWNRVKTLPEFLRAVGTRTPVRAEMHTIESDLFER